MRMKRFSCLLDVLRVQAVAAWRDARGSVLPLTLMIVVILTTMVIALLSVGAMESQIANNLLRSAQALNLAEAGAERAIAQFVADPSPVGTAAVGGPTVTLIPAQGLQNFGTYTVTYRPIAASTVLVESTGQTSLGNVTQRVRMVVTSTPLTPYAILGDNLQISGNAQISGLYGSVQGNTNTSITGTGAKVSQTATSASATCTGCTDPKYVGNVAGSGPNKPSQKLPTDTPMDYIKYANFIMGDTGTITVVAAPAGSGLTNGQVVNCGIGTACPAGPFAGWSMSKSQPGDWHFKGTTSPNGMYYASLEISIDTMSGTSAATPWKATLITGSSVNSGELELLDTSTSKPPNIIPYYQDLLGVGGAVQIRGNGVFTGTVIQTRNTRKLDCTKTVCNPLYMDANATLNGHILADGQVNVAGTSTINYNAGGAAPFGPPQILSWTRLAQ